VAEMTGTDILNQQVRVSDEASNCRVGDETVILHAGNGTYFGLDAVGSQIWHLLQDGMSPTEACAKIAQDFGVPLAQVEDDARLFLDDLKRHEIIRSI
jgi:outer membrane protein assembly factor BamB